MAIFTNHTRFGGCFKTPFESIVSKASSAHIAVGYTGADTVDELTTHAQRIASSGGDFKLLVGTPFFEGLSQANYEALKNLHNTVISQNKKCGVRLSIDTLFHGKMYQFTNSHPIMFAGSANLSSAGLAGNLEFVSELHGDEFKEAQNFLEFLMSDEQSAPIDKIEGLTIFDSTEYKQAEKPDLAALTRYSERIALPSEFIEVPFDNIGQKLSSGLNAYFGKGRENKKAGTVTPRPWFEVEVICRSAIYSRADYPKGDFTVFTDDGYTFDCKTSGDNFKNLRSKGDLQILGKWIKGKLQTRGVLAPFSVITKETLLRYGKTALRLYPLGGNRYYLEF
jgi:hypothetical protein